MKINPLHLLLIFRVTFILALSLTTYLSLIDIAELPEITRDIWDKLQHASAFFVLGFLLYGSVARAQLFSRSHITQVIFLLSYGIMIEWLQSYTPHREASVADVLADAVGIFCFSLLVYLQNTDKSSH